MTNCDNSFGVLVPLLIVDVEDGPDDDLDEDGDFEDEDEDEDDAQDDEDEEEDTETWQVFQSIPGETIPPRGS